MLARALCLQLLAAAAAPEVALDQAEQALRRLDDRAAAAGFEAACSRSPCSRLQLQRVYAGLATIQASSGQPVRAIESFKALLFIAPDWRLPPAASPRLRDPFEHALAWWRSRPAPRLVLTVPGAGEGTPAEVTVRLGADPLGLVQRLAVRASRGGRQLELGLVPGSLRAEAQGGISQKFAVPAGEGPIVLVAEARTSSGGVLVETEPLELRRPSLPPTTVVPAEPTPERPLLHLAAGAVFEPLNQRLGAEVRAAVSPFGFLDVSAGALIGKSPGLRVALEAHPPRRSGLSPLGQLRFAFHVLPDGLAVGGGAALGGSLAAGPGRLFLLAVGELYSAPAQIIPWAAFAALGYELDLPFVTAP